MDKSLAPSFVRVTYTGAGGIHHAIIPVNIVDGWVAGVEPSLTQRDGTPVPATDGITDYVNAWRGLMTTSQNIGLAEVYAVDADTGEGTFVWGFNLATTGMQALASVAKVGLQMTFKLVGGGTFRSLTMEGPYAADLNLRPPYIVDDPDDVFSTYVCGDSSIVYGRDNTYPFAPLRFLTKEYDALRKRAGL